MARRHATELLSANDVSGPTRGRILLLLCRGRQTVNELSAALDLTDNAVRAQLERLIAEGLVRQVGSRPGTRRPHAEFEMTELASKLFPKGYEPGLRALLDVLTERLPPAENRALLLESGRRVLRTLTHDQHEREPRRWFERLAAKLGGAAAGVEVLEASGATVIRSCTCPLAAVTRAHPWVCGLIAELLTEASGLNVHERCARKDSPRCAFEITDAPVGKHRAARRH